MRARQACNRFLASICDRGPWFALAAAVSCDTNDAKVDPQIRAGVSAHAVERNTVDPKLCTSDGCAIHLQGVATLSDKGSPGLFGDRIFIQRGPNGRYFTTTFGFEKVAVFDSSGTLLGTVGRRGSGPGEFQLAMITGATRGDSVFVYDMRQRRLVVIDRDLRIAREDHFPFFPQLRLPDGSIIVAEQVRTPERIGFPVHVLSPSGEILRSFGTDTPQYRADLHFLLNRVVGPAPDGLIWTAPLGKYFFEKWDPQTGKMLQQLQPKASWFRETVEPPGHPFVSRPTSVITQLREDAFGLLWVFAMDADENWQRRWMSEPAREAALSTDDRSAVYDWVVEVFDIKSGRQLAKYRSDREMWTRLPNDLVITRGSGGDAEVSFDVWELQLRAKEVER